ncbi:MAG: ATP-dependent Clp protease adaptor ClpS [Anaerolineales bacterium]
MSFQYQEDELNEVLNDLEDQEPKSLIVFNDDYNTFDHVINTLVKVCKHTLQQAEQCTWLIHYRGKCVVKTGNFRKLKPMRDGICDAGIDARIL